MSDAVAKKRLTKEQKIAKYGRKFSKGYLEFNKELLGGDVTAMKEEFEREDRIKRKLASERGESSSTQGYRGQDDLQAMLKGAVIKRSLSINKNAKSADDRLRLFTAQRIAKEQLSGYVTLVTNKGSLRFELFCASAPTACENFLGLCERQYYAKTSFHRLIKGFMLQGGDPSKTGKGGESLWGVPFQDETSRLSHSERGVLSMANSGPDSNGSQFFVTFAECRHLDGKHTIFGQLVGGMDVLSAIESTPTSSDRPTSEVTIQTCVVHFNPFTFMRKL